MSVWEYLGNVQSKLKQKPGQAPTPFNTDGRVPFGVSLDIAQTLPYNPTSFVTRKAEYEKSLMETSNDAIESGRQAVMSKIGSNLGTPQALAASAGLAVAAPAVGIPLTVINGAAFTLADLDKRTDGKASKVLMAGTKNVRSNYAFVADVAKHDAGLGFLATLGLIAGGTLGGIAGFAVAGPAGAFAGAALGAAIAGKGERDVAETGMFGKDLKNSAVFSESDVGQERYNFGRDATHLASKITTWQTLGDTTKGVGAIVSGLLNFGFETAVAPDIKATSLGGKVARNSLVGGITEPMSGLVGKKLAATPAGQARIAKRLTEDVDLLKRTGAGETTAYSPVFKFYRENDVATIMERPEFKGNEFGQIGANLVAGKSDEAISLVMRVGRGDKAAIDELMVKHPATFAEMLRYEGVLETLDARIPFSSLEKVQPTLNGKQIPIATTVIEAEIKDLRTQFSWLDKTLKLDGALQERTVSKVPGVEAFRNDAAKQRAINKLEQAAEDITTRETHAGKVIQTVYQKNGMSALIRTIERWTDDAPHATVNFNDPLQSASRVRTTMRATIVNKVLPGAEAKKYYDDFISAKNEGEKLAIVSKVEERVFEQVANKYNVPASIKDLVLQEYITLTKKNRQKAKAAQSENKAYMLDDNGDAVKDPQLISQLANGAYLPDVELIDKAFARYAKRMGDEVSLPVNAAIMGKAVLAEFNSIWRFFTLARTGFPINVIRDSTLRTWGDGAMFYSLKALTEQSMQELTRGANTAGQIKRWAQGVKDPKQNMKNIRNQISLHENSLLAAKQALKDAKYDPANPPKKMTPELQRLTDYVKKVESTAKELRRQEEALVAKIPSARVGRDKVNVSGYNFPAAFSGRFGDLSFQKLRGKDDIRGLLASVKELEMAEVRRDRVGGHAVKATDNEDIHMASWDNTLNNILRNDPISREIMSRNVKNMTPAQVEKEVVAWIRSPQSGTIVERFGYDVNLKRELKYSDAKYIYNRVLNAINMFAPDIKLQKLVMDDKANVLELKKMYPDLEARPTVISDLALDLTGQSNMVRKWSNMSKDVVTWLATVPTSRLSYNPYFQAKYEHKLQNMVAVANAQGRKLSDMNQNQFESVARAYAINEYRAKINSFNRDMNYPALLDHIMAFFPAVVEQYRAYGRLALEHPEFPQKILQMGGAIGPLQKEGLPDYLGNVQTDEFGTEYIEVTLPVLGINGRLPTSWFNPINPTGGHILSAGPVATATVNEVAKRTNLPDYFEQLVLPFGTQANALGALTPNTIRRGGQAFQAYFLKNGEQYNKDNNMFLEMKVKEFIDENHRKPSGADLANLYRESSDDAKSLAFIRALGAGILPSQPRYVTPLQKYADLLAKYNKDYGQDGAERFINDYPEYFILTEKLTDSTSGLRSDDTAVGLARTYTDVVENIVATVGKDNLSVLGSVLNDDNYAFSSTAQAYLVSNTIPGTRTKFKEQGAALENNRSAVVSQGWRDWNKLIENVTVELKSSNLTPVSGYGKAILDKYKDAFIAKAKTDNNLWYNEKAGPSFQSKQIATINALTIAANSDMWKDLSKQPRWHTIVDYLNFRYDVYDELKRRGQTITTADDLAEQAAGYVAQLRAEDVNFGKFYDRYLDGDMFDYVPD